MELSQGFSVQFNVIRVLNWILTCLVLRLLLFHSRPRSILAQASADTLYPSVLINYVVPRMSQWKWGWAIFHIQLLGNLEINLKNPTIIQQRTGTLKRTKHFLNLSLSRYKNVKGERSPEIELSLCQSHPAQLALIVITYFNCICVKPFNANNL